MLLNSSRMAMDNHMVMVTERDRGTGSQAPLHRGQNQTWHTHISEPR